MEIDITYIFYEKYFSLKNRTITVFLKNKTFITGQVISFRKGDKDFNENYISTIRFLKNDSIENYEGEIILIKNIEEIIFSEDNTKLKFK